MEAPILGFYFGGVCYHRSLLWGVKMMLRVPRSKKNEFKWEKNSYYTQVFDLFNYAHNRRKLAKNSKIASFVVLKQLQ